jgi:two-component system response regulator AtoC
VTHLLDRINEKVHKRVTRVPPEVLEHLTRLPWRGNVRELENVLTRAVVLAPGDVLRGDDLPPLEGPAQEAGRPAAPTPLFAPPAVDDASQIPTLEEAERVLITRAMAVTKGHKGKTCQILGISRPTLERKLQKYAIEKQAGGQALGVKDAS